MFVQSHSKLNGSWNYISKMFMSCHPRRTLHSYPQEEEAAEEEDRPGNSGGNSAAIPGNSEPFSAIRVFCACPKRREFGHSLPRQFPF